MLPIPVVNDRPSSSAGGLSAGRGSPADWLYRGLIA
jgi:hypothetical protein